MIIKELNKNSFVQEFQASLRKDNFTYTALEALYDYYEQFSSEESPFKLDIIAVCCDWSEYTAEELVNSYAQQENELDNVVEFVDNNYYLIKLDNGNYLIQNSW